MHSAPKDTKSVVLQHISQHSARTSGDNSPSVDKLLLTPQSPSDNASIGSLGSGSMSSSISQKNHSSPLPLLSSALVQIAHTSPTGGASGTGGMAHTNDSLDFPLMVERSEDGRQIFSPGEEEASLMAHEAQPETHQRKLGTFAVAIVLFATVAGGPYGIEAAIGAAGALPVLIGTVVLALTWSAPQALVAAELSTSFPSNGGYVTWVVKGLGPTLGFVNAANSLVSSVCNLPLYPVLFASYVQQLVPSISEGALFAVKLAGLLLTVGLNSFGIEAVSATNTIFTIIVQTTFILMPIAAAAYHQPFTWSGAASVTSNWQSEFSVFVSTLCWNALGWVNIGNVASEVRNPKRSYPLGAGLAVVLVALNYLYPVALCTALAPDPTQWDTGYFAQVGTNIAPWVGYYATVAAAFSCMNNFQPQLGTTARALRFAALYKMVPLKVLGKNWKRFNTPLPAILVQGVLVAILMNFGFDVLVIINVLFYDVGIFLQFAAFLRMRYTKSQLHRPFEAPGGVAGAWTIVLAFYSVLGIAVYAAVTTAWWSVVIVAGANVLFFIFGNLWAKYLYKPGLIEEVDAAETAPETPDSEKSAEGFVDTAFDVDDDQLSPRLHGSINL